MTSRRIDPECLGNTVSAAANATVASSGNSTVHPIRVYRGGSTSRVRRRAHRTPSIPGDVTAHFHTTPLASISASTSGDDGDEIDSARRKVLRKSTGKGACASGSLQHGGGEREDDHEHYQGKPNNRAPFSNAEQEARGQATVMGRTVEEDVEA